MWSSLWTALALAVCAQAQGAVTSTSSVLVPENTITPSSTLPTTTIVVTTTTTIDSTTVTVTATVVATSTVTVTSGITSTSISSSTTTSTSATTTTSSGPVVTDQAYIDTVLRHHNQHRLNHTSGDLTWNAALAETARKIANSCVYQHDTTTDCTGPSSCYGQNIAAGYLPTRMGTLISEGFYNSEVNSYTYYGGEPDINTFTQWGHFSQIVWKTTTNSVGCYTNDCSGAVGGLTFPGGGGQGIPPFFTICNYGGPGNYVGEFTTNVLAPVGLPSIFGGFGCPTADNCVNGAT